MRDSPAWRWYIIVLAALIPVTTGVVIGGYRVSPALGDLVIGIGVIALLWRFGPRGLVVWPIVPYVSVTVLSTIYGFHVGGLSHGTLFAELLKITAVYGYVLMGSALLTSEGNLFLLLSATRWMGTAQALYGLTGVVLRTACAGALPLLEQHRALGTLPKANVAGLYFVMALLATLILYSAEKTRTFWSEAAYLAGMLVLMAGVVATGTRGSMFALLVVAAVYGLTRGAAGKRLIKPLALVVSGLAGLLMVAPGSIRDWIARSIGRSATVVERLHLWGYALDLFGSLPPLQKVIGLGRGGFITAMQRSATEIAPRNPHNTPLLLLVETGVLGFLAFYGMVVHVSVRLTRIWSLLPARLAVLLSLYWLGGLAVMVQGFTNDVTEFRFIWLLIGSAYAVTLKYAKESGV